MERLWKCTGSSTWTLLCRSITSGEKKRQYNFVVVVMMMIIFTIFKMMAESNLDISMLSWNMENFIRIFHLLKEECQNMWLACYPLLLLYYRGGKICLSAHFKPLWSKNVPRFGVAHALALGVGCTTLNRSSIPQNTNHTSSLTVSTRSD